MAYREGQGLEQERSPIRPERDLSGALSLTAEALTLLGNILPVFVVFRFKSRSERTVTDILIGTLSLNDIFSVLLPLPVSLPSFIAPGPESVWQGGKPACIFYQFSVYWLQNSAMLLVTAMALERWLAVTFPIRYKAWTTHGRARVMVVVIFGSTFVVACLPIMGLAPPAVSEEGSRFCRSWIATQPEMWYHSVFPIVLITQGWVTMVLVLVLDVCLMVRLARFRRRLKAERSEVPSERKSIREFTVLVLVVAILFYCTWLPVLVVLTVTQCGVRVSELIAVYALMSTTLNGLLNPLVYCVLSRQYREGYARCLRFLVVACGLQNCFGGYSRWRESSRFPMSLGETHLELRGTTTHNGEEIAMKVTVL
ncbi:nociceptin receptor-like [Diadema antillarum]|uniref:nociceptin receptor-like n=1 Tax=Diadema antillarum TaxID=105358 RepID=UPI003A844D28